jgi:histidine triad (HIT) family protein
MAQNCIFCEIAAGKRDAAMVFQDESSIAFLDHRPLFPGHCLLIPKAHYETLADLPRSGIEPLFANAQMLAEAMEAGLQAEGSFVAVNNRISQSVPHLHIHVVPRRKKDGLKGFFWPRGKYPHAEAMEKVRAALEQTMNGLRTRAH